MTSQLKKPNHGKEVLYTRKFEKQLMNLMGGDHDEDDEEFFLYFVIDTFGYISHGLSLNLFKILAP